MKYRLILILIIFYSCVNQNDIANRKIESKIKRINDKIIQDYKDYKIQITESGFNNLLNVDRLKIDTSKSESKEILKKAKSILTAYNKQNKNMIRETHNLIDSLIPTKNIDVKIMRSKFDEIINQMNSNFKTDSTYLSMQIQMFKILENCKYNIINSKIEFETIDCMMEYSNQHSQMIVYDMEVKNKHYSKLLN